MTADNIPFILFGGAFIICSALFVIDQILHADER